MSICAKTSLDEISHFVIVFMVNLNILTTHKVTQALEFRRLYHQFPMISHLPVGIPVAELYHIQVQVQVCEFNMIQTKLSIVFILASDAPVVPQSSHPSYSRSENLLCVYFQCSVADTSTSSILIISSLGIIRTLGP